LNLLAGYQNKTDATTRLARTIMTQAGTKAVTNWENDPFVCNLRF
jgi:hypothetical protein